MASWIYIVCWGGKTWNQQKLCILFSIWQAFKILKDVPIYSILEQMAYVSFITLRVTPKVQSHFPLRDCFRLSLLGRTFILSYNIIFEIPECKVLPYFYMSDTVTGRENLQGLITSITYYLYYTVWKFMLPWSVTNFQGILYVKNLKSSICRSWS